MLLSYYLRRMWQDPKDDKKRRIQATNQKFEYIK